MVKERLATEINCVRNCFLEQTIVGPSSEFVIRMEQIQKIFPSRLKKEEIIELPTSVMQRKVYFGKKTGASNHMKVDSLGDGKESQNMPQLAVI